MIIAYGPFVVSKMWVLHSRGGHLHFITNNVQKKEGATYWNIYIYIYNIIYLNVNRVHMIHFENILKIYLKYVRNMPLFHNILKIILLLQMLPKIYKEWPLQDCIHNMPFYKATPTCRCIWKPLGFYSRSIECYFNSKLQ